MHPHSPPWRKSPLRVWLSSGISSLFELLNAANELFSRPRNLSSPRTPR
uniref:Uncharacterized protein n=1 Tax=Anguilla anguilla TaxID=7936 RepID=A0A0E9QRT6_ANGAN